MERLFFASCHIAALTLLTCSALLLLRRREGNIARVALATTFIILGVTFASRVTALYAHIGPSNGADISVQLLGLFVVTTYLIYPVRSIFARRLRGFRIAIIYLPLAFYVLLYLKTREAAMSYPLFDISNIFSTGGFWRFDVLFRIVVFASSLAASLIMLRLVMRYSTQPRLRTYITLIQVFPLFIVIAGVFPRDVFLIGAIYQATSALLAVYFTYQEVFFHAIVVRDTKHPVRMHVHEPFVAVGQGVDIEPVAALEKDADDKSNEGNNLVDSNPQPKDIAASESPLWIKLEEYMRREQPWRNPEIRITDLAQRLGTNRTTLSAEIHAHGYERFYDYIVKYRIEAFCEIIKTDNRGNIKTAFFEVGFRSTSGAFKQFKLIHNMTPKQYVASQDSIKYDA